MRDEYFSSSLFDDNDFGKEWFEDHPKVIELEEVDRKPSIHSLHEDFGNGLGDLPEYEPSIYSAANQ